MQAKDRKKRGKYKEKHKKRKKLKKVLTFENQGDILNKSLGGDRK